MAAVQLRGSGADRRLLAVKIRAVKILQPVLREARSSGQTAGVVSPTLSPGCTHAGAPWPIEAANDDGVVRHRL